MTDDSRLIALYYRIRSFRFEVDAIAKQLNANLRNNEELLICCRLAWDERRARMSAK